MRLTDIPGTCKVFVMSVTDLSGVSHANFFYVRSKAPHICNLAERKLMESSHPEVLAICYLSPNENWRTHFDDVCRVQVI